MRDFRGIQFDHYLILDSIGRGGMALVYKAYDLRLERDVAIKMIRTDEIPPSQLERLMKRFEREARAQSKFSHPNIVSVFDFGKYQDVPYLVLAYLPGGNLKERLQSAMPVDEALRILIQISDAVAYAHSNGVLHRDIKPSNIIFDSNDNPLLADFGIAKVLEANEGTLTGTGLGVGTPEYMAPEQWQGKASESSDQYALGVLLYELATGQKPYTAETPLAVALKQINEPLKQPRELVPDLPIPIENVIFKSLAINPRDRFENVEDFYNRLKDLSEEFFPAKNVLKIEDVTGALSPSLQQIDLDPPISENVTKDQIPTALEKEDPVASESINEIKIDFSAPSTPEVGKLDEKSSEVWPKAVAQAKKTKKEQQRETGKILDKAAGLLSSRYIIFPMLFILLSFGVWGVTKNISGMNLNGLFGAQQESTSNGEETVLIDTTEIELLTKSQTLTQTLTYTLTQTLTHTLTQTKTTLPTKTQTHTATQTPTSTATAIFIQPTATSAPVIVNTQPPAATNPPPPPPTNPPPPTATQPPPPATNTPASAPTREPTPTPP